MAGVAGDDGEAKRHGDDRQESKAAQKAVAMGAAQRALATMLMSECGVGKKRKMHGDPPR